MRYYEHDDTRREDDLPHFRELKMQEERLRSMKEEDTLPQLSYWYQD
jgi:hypothetical protein